MKKVVMIMFVCIFAIANGLLAQDFGANRIGKILELKKAFLQEKLSLSEDEMSQFWPIHKKYIMDRRSVMQAMKGIKNKVKDNDNLSDAEFIGFVDELSDLRIDEIKLDKLHAKSVVIIIGVSRFKELKPLEKEFKSEMREKRDARSGGQGKPGRDAPRPDRESDKR